ncbi:MAG: carbohydrate ABC transporter permease, partial [Sphaerochaetaceae bacterium]
MTKKTHSLDHHTQVKLIPSYVLIVTWVIFTFVLIGWVIFASLSTSQEIFSDSMFKFETGFHFENYVRAWNTQKVSVYFMNSVLYTVVACSAIILIASPAAYVLSRFKFRGNISIQNLLA